MALAPLFIKAPSDDSAVPSSIKERLNAERIRALGLPHTTKTTIKAVKLHCNLSAPLGFIKKDPRVLQWLTLRIGDAIRCYLELICLKTFPI